MSELVVVGGGAWGTALAHAMTSHGQPVPLWARGQRTVDEINAKRTNKRYLDDIKLNDAIRATRDLSDLQNAEFVLIVTPAQTLDTVIGEIVQTHSNPNAVFILCAKGIDETSGLLPHQTARKYLAASQIATLSGPSYSKDVARGLPTAVTLAAQDLAQAEALSAKLATPNLRLYASDDLIGVEAGGALKNVMALAVGMTRGLKLGASAEAALIARGFAELSRLTIALGGRSETLAGLSGLGDLVLTCSTPQSRNFAYGIALAKGDDIANLPLAEGVKTVKQAVDLAKGHKVDAPICAAVAQVLSGTLSAADAARTLLARPLRSET